MKTAAISKIGCVLAGLMWLQFSPALVAAAERPNIILAMADDQGWRDVGYNPEPGKVAITPNLDRMAAEGVRFSRFYSSAPNCAPTRATLLTGRHCHRCGVFNPGFALHPRELTIAEVLQEAGYATAHFGKWHLGPVKASSPVNPHVHGFDHYVSHDNFFDLDPPLSRNGAEPEEFKGDGSEVIVDEALKFIDSVKRSGKPFFTFICFGSPHKPHKALDRDKALYADMPPDFQNYFGEITAMDRSMGTLRAGLKQRGIDQNTIIWYMSDNGSYKPMDKITGLRGHKGEVWEGGIRVPGLIVWPAKIAKPLYTEFPASTSDIMPTIVDLLGIKQEMPKFDGISIKPILYGIDMTERGKPMPYWRANARAREVGNNPSDFTEEQLRGWWRDSKLPNVNLPKADAFQGDIAWIEGDWKLHMTNKGYELYNLAEDQAETTDVARQHPEVVARLSERLLAWLRDAEVSLAGGDRNQ
jgi:arylsulfatase A-like enzyme